MYKNILFLFSSILIISVVSSQQTAPPTETDPKNPLDNSSQQTYQSTDIDGKELPVNQEQHITGPTVYSTFIPQDAVQQYVSQYGAGFTGQALEGFLIPTYERSVPEQEPTPVVMPAYVSVFRTLLPAPRLIMAVLAKIVAFVASAVGILFFGTLICTLTPICNPAFPAILRKETKEIVEKIGEEITTERVKRAAELFSMAISKYQDMQKVINKN